MFGITGNDVTRTDRASADRVVVRAIGDPHALETIAGERSSTAGVGTDVVALNHIARRQCPVDADRAKAVSRYNVTIGYRRTANPVVDAIQDVNAALGVGN